MSPVRRPTTTTPESRASIARPAFLRQKYSPQPVPMTEPTFEQLPADEQAQWINAARVVWEIATTGRASL
jgi:hypothetical protein